MRGLVVFFLVLLFGGCSDSPSDAGATAEVVADEGGSFSDCVTIITTVCNFIGEGRNLGPDCAQNVRGVTRFYRSGGGQVGAAASWEGPFHLRPGEAFTYRVNNVGPPITNEAVSYGAEASWTSVRC